ncbi:MAG: hypothetical protein ABLQ96_04485, partial [Candidatus Acidiferrum sp.]
ADAMASSRHEDKKALIALSREVVEKAEDAREISVKHIDEERVARERSAGEGREADAKARAHDAESETAEAVRERNEADRKNRDAQAVARLAAGAQADAERIATRRSKNSNPRRRILTATAPTRRPRTPNFNKPCATAKIFARSFCSNSI